MMKTGPAPTRSTASASSNPPCSTSPSLARAKGSASSPPRSSRSATPAVGGRPVHARKRNNAPPRCRAFKPSSPWSFCGLFPVDANDFEDRVRDAMEKLALNGTRSFTFEIGNLRRASAFGLPLRVFSWACCHLEVIPRPPRTASIDIDLITTAPSVILPRPHARRHHDRAAQPRRHARPDARGSISRSQRIQGDHHSCPNELPRATC